MEQLIKQVKALVAEELQRAAKLHGAMLHSAHEAYAVTLEERDEGIKNVAEIDKSLDEYWIVIALNSKMRLLAKSRKLPSLPPASISKWRLWRGKLSTATKKVPNHEEHLS